MSLMQVAKWNYLRNGLVYNEELEINMLNEEEQEFKDALKMYFDSTNSLFNETACLDAVVDMVDAYCDFTFVYYGTKVKSMGTLANIDLSSKLSIMNTMLTEVLITHGVDMFQKMEAPIIEQCMSLVIEANEAKPIKKTKAKVSKGSDWKDPKQAIKELLVEKGFIADIGEAMKQLKDRIESHVKPKKIDIKDL